MTIKAMAGADGKIELYWEEMQVVHGNVLPRTMNRSIALADLVMWDIEHDCLVLLYPDHREMIPLARLTQMNFMYNTAEGVKAVRHNRVEPKNGDSLKEFANIRVLDGGKA